jgi:hypothetical protein
VTTPRRERHQNPATTPSAGEKAPAEMSEPYDPPDPEDRWPAGRAAYLIVVDQLRDWQPGRHSPSLAELLETRSGRAREPEPDLEAEP